MKDEHSQQTSLHVIEDEKQQIKELVGLSDLSAIAFNDVGWTSRVYIIHNGQYVFKFPRAETVKNEYAQEIALFKLLDKQATHVQVPKVRWTHPRNDYLGYEGIIGQEFTPLAAHMSIEVKRSIGRAIGSFLKQLHALNLHNARTMTVHDEIKEFQYKYGLALRVIERDFSQEEQAKLKALLYDEMPSELTQLGRDKALCHGDLGYWNMILKPDNHIGIIDFGDVGYYDRSKDFIGLQDNEILDQALGVYGDNPLLRQKITIRQKVLYILDLPFFIGKNDEQGITRTVAKIRAGL